MARPVRRLALIKGKAVKIRRGCATVSGGLPDPAIPASQETFPGGGRSASALNRQPPLTPEASILEFYGIPGSSSAGDFFMDLIRQSGGSYDF